MLLFCAGAGCYKRLKNAMLKIRSLRSGFGMGAFLLAAVFFTMDEEEVSEMIIRKTEESDLSTVMEIYANAREYMAKSGNPNQWGPTNWPPEKLVREDIRCERSYVCVSDCGEILGVFCFIMGKNAEPSYENIEDGEWLDESPYGVMHRIASSGKEKGIGAFCIDWAFDRCGHMRIDTHPDNKTMQRLLEKLGFSKRGIIHVEEDVYPRFAYEKTIEHLRPHYGQ